MYQLFDLQLRTAQMLVEAQGVVNLRLMGLAGLVPSRSDEVLRMVLEKQSAFAEAGLAATGALMAGKTPAQAYDLALAPIGRRTRDNARRLAR
ncbi:antifreeze protein [Jannaschia marina]|uniref:antifreeze protein n=1 Tax=Jannaschia marina TaxID=2741674 RepID=UPI0015CD5B0A|nr:antifreeze protein [Jannaschia marina]